MSIFSSVALVRLAAAVLVMIPGQVRGGPLAISEAYVSSNQQQACPDGSVDSGRKLGAALSGAIITNGLIKLGVTEQGALNVAGGLPTPDGETAVGLRYIFPDGSESESTSYGCTCEGWGVGANGEPIFFNIGVKSSPSSAYSHSFTSTATTAILTVVYTSGKLRVTHDYHPASSTPNLYEVTVILENTSGATINDLRYRRVFDWDVYPTPFDECVTIQPDPSTVDFLAAATNDGFVSSNPYVALTNKGCIAPFTDLGPKDHGAAFDFQFEPLAAGESFTFKTYYGAAGNEADAGAALGAVGAEVYSFGKPAAASGGCTDTPNVYIFGFAAVGGEVLFTAPPSASPQPSESPSISTSPTPYPSSSPTKTPTDAPSSSPSNAPSKSPSSSPTKTSTDAASSSLSNAPSQPPTKTPTNFPTVSPTANPTKSPSVIDTDGDGLSDNYENTPNPHVTDPENPDTDGDNLSDAEEEDEGTDPNNPDTDGDGLTDGHEVKESFTDPLQKQPTSSPTTNPTSSPTTSPSSSPTAGPTTSPTSIPSLQPSIVEEVVTTRGFLSVNANICIFTQEELAAFVAATLTTIRSFACNDVDTCVVEINSICGSRSARRSLSSRNLQVAQTWQMEYEVTDTFTCEIASCSSDRDTAAASAIADSIASSMIDSIQSGGFVTILSANIVKSSSLDHNIVTCLVAWGIVDAPVMEMSDPGTGVFYPDWKSDSGTCLQDGNEPIYMNNKWLSNSLEDCCERYYSGWNKNKCMNIGGSGLWYVSDANGKCMTDCEEENGKTCGGLANPVSDDLFTDPRSCCESKLTWVFVEFCEADSLLSNCYGGTKLYYRGDTAGSKVCVRDCDPASGDTTCGGLVEDSYVVLHDSAEDCCSTEYDWIETELCAARSTQTAIDKYWPDQINGKCIKDSETPAEDLSVSLFNSTVECCTAGISWLSEAVCVAASGDTATAAQGSGKFFIDWVYERCAKDCEGSAPCGGLAQSWDLYEAESACCDMIPWIARENCVYTGIETAL